MLLCVRIGLGGVGQRTSTSQEKFLCLTLEMRPYQIPNTKTLTQEMSPYKIQNTKYEHIVPNTKHTLHCPILITISGSMGPCSVKGSGKAKERFHRHPSFSNIPFLVFNLVSQIFLFLFQYAILILPEYSQNFSSFKPHLGRGKFQGYTGVWSPHPPPPTTGVWSAGMNFVPSVTNPHFSLTVNSSLNIKPALLCYLICIHSFEVRS